MTDDQPHGETIFVEIDELVRVAGNQVEKTLTEMTGSSEGYGPAFVLIVWKESCRPGYGANREGRELTGHISLVLEDLRAKNGGLLGMNFDVAPGLESAP